MGDIDTLHFVPPPKYLPTPAPKVRYPPPTHTQKFNPHKSSTLPFNQNVRAPTKILPTPSPHKNWTLAAKKLGVEHFVGGRTFRWGINFCWGPFFEGGSNLWGSIFVRGGGSTFVGVNFLKGQTLCGGQLLLRGSNFVGCQLFEGAKLLVGGRTFLWGRGQTMWGSTF